MDITYFKRAYTHILRRHILERVTQWTDPSLLLLCGCLILGRAYTATPMVRGLKQACMTTGRVHEEVKLNARLIRKIALHAL